MAFLDKVGKKISQAKQDVEQSTKNFTTINKLNNQISDEQENIKNYYLEIGKIYFELFNETPEENLTELITNVKISLLEIEKCNEQIKEIKGIRNCPSCNAEIPYTSAFCNSCGTKMPVRTTEEIFPQGNIKCPKCSNILPNGFKFCTFCGTAIEAISINTKCENKNIQDVIKQCPNCNKELNTDASFCTECGYKF